MKTYLSIMALALAFTACESKAETYHKSQPANPITKFEAMRASFNDPSVSIFKCSEVRITEKGTLKNVPSSGNNNFIVPVKK